jgi:hypothetical protein
MFPRRELPMKMKSMLLLVSVLPLMFYGCKSTATGPVDTTAPTVSITSPANNSTVIDSVLIVASASDDVGVVKVEFYIDGLLTNTLKRLPWLYYWNVRSLAANTTHTIQVKGYDDANNMASSQVVSVTTKRTAEFLFPLAVGAQWTYSHTYYYNYPTAQTYDIRWGTVVWRVTSSAQSADSTVWSLHWSQRDSVHYHNGMRYYPIVIDTVYLNLVEADFTVAIWRDAIEARWAYLLPTASATLSHLPRYVTEDTVTLYTTYNYATYASGVGLKGYLHHVYANISTDEQLTLLSFSGH